MKEIFVVKLSLNEVENAHLGAFAVMDDSLSFALAIHGALRVPHKLTVGVCTKFTEELLKDREALDEYLRTAEYGEMINLELPSNG